MTVAELIVKLSSLPNPYWDYELLTEGCFDCANPSTGIRIDAENKAVVIVRGE